mmetsp:Transcript_7279/g.10651  ORF Transcript_7279/g.10651 Transcript_7279/m.10651 type:complete len:177 (+) Transcript_7279:112-642(+)
MRAFLRYQPTSIPCIQAYRIDRLEDKRLPIDRADWDKGCDRIDTIFLRYYRLAVALQIVSSFPGVIAAMAGMVTLDLILVFVGIALFLVWAVTQCVAFSRFQRWMDNKVNGICQDMERSSNASSSFSYNRIRGTCGCDSEYFVKIGLDDEQATMASSFESDEESISHKDSYEDYDV